MPEETVEEIVATDEDLEKLYGRFVRVYRMGKEHPFMGELGADKKGREAYGVEDKGISAIISEKGVFPLRVLDIVNALEEKCPKDIIYIPKAGTV